MLASLGTQIDALTPAQRDYLDRGGTAPERVNAIIVAQPPIRIISEC